ncbi:MAG: 7-cyano-7-deazaguanine synthase [Kiritimatiellia bacterium]
MELLARLGAVVPESNICIAFSGGMDSAVLATACARLGKTVRLLHVQTFLQTSRERRMVHAVAECLGLPCEEVVLDLSNADFLLNHTPRRCYHCKRHLLRALLACADGAPLLEGTQADDDLSDRPGFQAVEELGVRSPWLEAGIGKYLIQAAADAWQLPVAGLRPSACLATRIPFGTPVTPDLAQIVDQAEETALALERFGDVRFRLEVRD